MKEKDIEKLQNELQDYKARIQMIIDIVFDYNGLNTNNAEQMKGLVDQLVGIAKDGIWLAAGENDLIPAYPFQKRLSTKLEETLLANNYLRERMQQLEKEIEEIKKEPEKLIGE